MGFLSTPTDADVAAQTIVILNLVVEPLKWGDDNGRFVAVTTTTDVRMVGPFSRPPMFVAPFAAALARPWRWRALGIAAGETLTRFTFQSAGDGASYVDQHPSLSVAELEELAKPLDDMAAWLASPGTSLEEGPAPTWAHALENVIRLPGQLGRKLQLVHYIKTDDAERLAQSLLPPSFEAEVKEPSRILIAESGLGGVLPSDYAPITNLFEDDNKGSRDQGVTHGVRLYPYRLSVKGDPDNPPAGVRMFVRLKRHQLRIVDDFEKQEHPFVNKRLWVQFPEGYNFWSGRDWFAHVPADIANAANLATHFAAGFQNWREKAATATDPTEVKYEAALFRAQMQLMTDISGFGAGEGTEAETAGEIPTPWTGVSVLRKAGAEDATFARMPGSEAPLTKLSQLWQALVVKSKPYDSNKPDEGAKPLGADDFVAQFVGSVVFTRPADAAVPESSKPADATSPDPDIAALFKLKSRFFFGPAPTGNRQDWTDVAADLARFARLYADPKLAVEMLLERWEWALGKAALASLRQALGDKGQDLRVRPRLILDAPEMRKFWGNRTSPDHLDTDGGLNAKVEEALAGGAAGLRAGFKPTVAQSVIDLRRRAYVAIMGRLDASLPKAGDDIFDWPRLRRFIAVEVVNALLKVGGDGDAEPVAADNDGLPKDPSPDARQPTAEDVEFGSRLSTPAPQPLVFQLGDISDDHDERDPLIERLAGFGVLAQNFGALDHKAPWYCLTLGQLSAGEPAKYSNPPVLYGHNPWRVVGQAGFTAWVISYHGLPLTARPVLHDLFELYGDEQAAEPFESIYPVKQIDSTGTVPERWKKLLALAYGRTYRFAFFAQTHSGAFGPDLTDPADPGAFRLPDTVQGPETQFLKIRYLRRTPIGAPILSVKENPDSLIFPQPSRAGDWPVFPLVEDLVGRGVLVEERGREKADRFETQRRPTADEIGPFALLAPQSRKDEKAPNHDESPWWVDPAVWDVSADAMPGQVRFQVGRPSTPVNDRVLWRARDLDEKPGDEKAVRKEIGDILRVFHTKELHANVRSAPSDARAPDDPAVERGLIRVWKIDPTAEPPRIALGEWNFSWPAPDPKKPEMERWRGPPVGVTVTALAALEHDSDPPKKKSDGNPFAIDLRKNPPAVDPGKLVDGYAFFVEEGGIYRFEFFSAVREELFADNGRHDTQKARIRTLQPQFTLGARLMTSPRPEILDLDGQRHALVAMRAMTVEVARGDFIEQVGRKAVFESTDVLSASPAGLELGLRTDDAKRKPWLFWQAKRAILNRQLWGWSGRAYAFPVGELAAKLDDLTTPNSPGSLLEPVNQREGDGWARFIDEDGAWFGDRADVDSTIAQGLLTPPVPAGSDHGGAALPSGPSYRVSLEHDPRAQYWRFSARVESRYIGMLAPAERARRGRVRGPWRRLLIKARPKAQLPKPRLRFILPLTEPYDLGAGAPQPDAPPISSLLVLLDEQWGESAGFAEKLEAEIMQWQDDVDTFDPSKPPLPLDPSAPLQAGFDPIASRQQLKYNGAGALAPLKVDSWPVGLTFDVDVDRPRPAAAAFQLRLDPKWMAQAQGDRALWAQDVFAQVRLRRTLAPTLAAVSNPGSFASDWTAPEWVIFNADARFWRLQTPGASPYVRSDDLRLARDGSILQSNPEGGWKPVRLMANPAEDGSPMTRRLFALVTRERREADGSVSEAFETIGEIFADHDLPRFFVSEDAKSTEPKSSAKGTKPPPLRRRLRLLEIEMHRNFAKLYHHEYADLLEKQNLTEMLFTTPDQIAERTLDKVDLRPEAHWLWDFLFPKPAPTSGEPRDALARIRRISPPIPDVES